MKILIYDSSSRAIEVFSPDVEITHETDAGLNNDNVSRSIRIHL